MRSAIRPTVLVLLLVRVAAPACADNTPMAELLQFERIDHVSAGVNGIGAPGSAGGGAGSIQLGGVSGDVLLALLYWHGIDIDYPELGLVGGDHDYDEAAIVFDGVAVTGTRVAWQGANNGWPSLAPQAPSAALYRADVTARVQLRGNGSYALAGLADASDGHSANGASLIVYFDDGQAGNDVRITHYEGLQSNEGGGWNFQFDVDYQGGRVDAIAHVADGQSVLPDGETRLTVQPGVSGTTATQQVRFGTSHYDGLPLWGGASVPGMGLGRSLGGERLWDIRRLHLVSLFGPPRTYSVSTSLASSSDLLALLVVQVEQPVDPQATMVDPNPFDFGDVVEDTISAPQRFAFRNLLPHPIRVTNAPSVTSARYQVVAQTCGDQVLAPGAICMVDVACAPTTVSHLSPQAVQVVWQPTSGNASNRTSYAQLLCSGVPNGPFSRVDGVPASCDFGDLTAGRTSAPTRILASNTGTLPLTVTEASVFPLSARPRFPLVGQACIGQMLQPGQSCAVDLGFNLLATQVNQTVEANLVVRFSAADTASATGEIPLAGTGIGAQGDALFGNDFDWLTCLSL